MVTSWAITECTPEGTEQVYSNWTPRTSKANLLEIRKRSYGGL